MSTFIILEGARAMGKSTTAFKLRQKVNYSTLINPTGFPDKGQEGLDKITHYYHAWFNFFRSFRGQDIKFISDRFFFSEAVFSKLYKDYNFRPTYTHLLERTKMAFDKIIIFFMYNYNRSEIAERLIRDKVAFANVLDTSSEILKQQEEYNNLFSELKTLIVENGWTNIEVIDINTSQKSLEIVLDEILSPINDRI